MNDYDWRDDANCLGIGGAVFFPIQGESSAPAKKVCAPCTARTECLLFALDNNIDEGVFGGTTPRERFMLRRAMRKTVA